jgi:hypothetical protein
VGENPAKSKKVNGLFGSGDRFTEYIFLGLVRSIAIY